mgnify:CR=1 FL=1
MRRARDSVLANICARVPHAARRAARVHRAAARRARHDADADQQRELGALARARHAAPHAAHRQPARERAHRVRASSPSAARASRCAEVVEDAAMLDRLAARASAASSCSTCASRGPAAGRTATRRASRRCSSICSPTPASSRPEGSSVRVGARRGRTGRVPGSRTRVRACRRGDRRSHLRSLPRAAAQEPEPAGLGLGLWIVKSIIERHGGSDQLRSAPPAGRTRFTVTLPLESPLA